MAQKKDSKPSPKARRNSVPALTAGETVTTDASTIDLSNPQFQDVWNLLRYTRNSVFLTGKAGTGKSTFLRYIISNIKKKSVVLAPTGIAAVNVGGQTMHSFFKLPFKPLLPDDPDFATKVLRKRMKYSSTFVKLLRNLDLIVIDEVSMVRADIIDFMDKILRVYTGNMRLPFGGKQMLFVGDVFQLEPVVKGEARDMLARYYDTPYFFNAKVFNEMSLVSIELRKVYRQTDSHFVSMLDRIRAGSPTTNDIDELNSHLRTNNAGDSAFAMTIATRREMVDNINESHLNELKTKEETYMGSVEGEYPMDSLPTDMELRLKVGAQVVFIKNDSDHRWVNGTIAVVRECRDDCIIVSTEKESFLQVVRERWSNIRYVYNEEKHTIDEVELGAFTQFPLKLAWALTIHKSQGLTFDNVIIDIGRGAFAGGQTYVALSRCRTLEGISLRSTINARDVYVDANIRRFASGFNDSSTIDKALEQSRADKLYEDAGRAWKDRKTGEAVDAFCAASALRNETGKQAVVRLLRIKLSEIDRLRGEIVRMKETIEASQKKLDKVAAQYVTLGQECSDEAWDHKAALVNYDRALEMSPDYYPAVLAKGILLSEMEHNDEAHTVLLHACKLCPTDFKPVMALGDIEYGEGDLAAAMGYYLHVVELNDSYIPAYTCIAEIYRKLGDEDEAAQTEAIIRKLKRKKKK